jgi:hypothetical protein
MGKCLDKIANSRPFERFSIFSHQPLCILNKYERQGMGKTAEIHFITHVESLDDVLIVFEVRRTFPEIQWKIQI